MKKFFKWLGKNKGALLQTCTAVLGASDLLLGYFGQTEIAIGDKSFSLVGLILLAASVIIGVATKGFTTVTVAEAIDTAKKAMNDAKVEDSDEKRKLKALKTQLHLVERKKKELADEYAEQLERLELGIASDIDLNEIEVYNAKCSQINTQIEKIQAMIQQLEGVEEPVNA